VTSFEEYGGPPLLEIDGGRMSIPFVKAICVDIRPDAKLILVDLPEGLEDLEAPANSRA
jgi:ribosomal 30S subunit maturation factor RimM